MTPIMRITDGYRLYAVVHRDHAYYLVGPFESYGTLRIWGEYEEKNGDDPRWQSIELKDNLVPEIHAADWHPPR